MALVIKWPYKAKQTAMRSFPDWEALNTALQEGQPRAVRLLKAAVDNPNAWPDKRETLARLYETVKAAYDKAVPPLPPKVEDESAPADA